MMDTNLILIGDHLAITPEEAAAFLKKFTATIPAGAKILILPPDFSRKHSGGGVLTAMLYRQLQEDHEIVIMPASGTHEPMTEAELREMFGAEIPLNKFVTHDWNHDVVKVGEIPAADVKRLSEGILTQPIEVKINQRLVSGEYDRIISVGQVLPHEVVGMANYNKNIFVGCGGPDIIHKSHFTGAAFGMEKIIGKDHSPVRKLYDFAAANFLKKVPLVYLFCVNRTITRADDDQPELAGLFIGTERSVFEKAVELSQRVNIIQVGRPLTKAVVYLDAKIFKKTWIADKAVYRTKLAMADGGELLIIAPGLRGFGESDIADRLIRKYGYVGRDRILSLVAANVDLQERLSIAAHLIHGSSEGKFTITYACKDLSKEDIESVNYHYLPLQEALERYRPDRLKYGYNTLDDGETIYYIENPATGLWVV
jgi:nickel-dependent lactate racemase